MEIIKTELYKIKKDNLFWGMLIYIFVALLTMAGKEIEFDNKMETIGLDMIFRILNSKEMFIYISYIAMIYSSKIISDYNSGYFMDSIALGTSRVKLWLGKVTIHSLFSSCLCLTPIASMAVGCVTLGGGIPNGFELSKFMLLIALTLLVSFVESFFAASIMISFPSVKILVIMIIAINLIVQVPVLFNVFVDFYKWTIWASLVSVYENNIGISDVIRNVLVSAFTVLFSAVMVKFRFLNKEM